MKPCELTASIVGLANALACQLTKEELAYWGIVLAQLGETMGTLAALEDLCKPGKQSTTGAVEEFEATRRNPGLFTHLIG